MYEPKSTKREEGAEKARSAKMGGGMMMKRNVAMKKGGKIPPQLKKFVMAKKKKLSKMRAYCKRKSDEQRAACGCRKKKTSESEYRPYT